MNSTYQNTQAEFDGPKNRNPFIDENSRGGTQYDIDCTLRMLGMYIWGLQEIADHSVPNDNTHLSGIMRALEGGERRLSGWLAQSRRTMSHRLEGGVMKEPSNPLHHEQRE